jgi:multidrug efflux pump subunit AcrB
MKRPEIQYAITNFNPNFPQYQMDINERAKDAGVEIATIFNTMQGYYGLYTTDFNKFGKQYRVMIQANLKTVPTLNLLQHLCDEQLGQKSGDKSVRRFRKNLWS